MHLVTEKWTDKLSQYFFTLELNKWVSTQVYVRQTYTQTHTHSLSTQTCLEVSGSDFV